MTPSFIPGEPLDDRRATGPVWVHSTYLVDAETALDVVRRGTGNGLSIRLGQGPGMICIGLLDDSAERLLETLRAAIEAKKSYHMESAA